MAIGDSYATVGELKSRLSIPAGNTDYDAEMGDALTSASEEIERHCNRQFNKATSATARSYTVPWGYVASVDDFHTTTGLAVETDSSGDGTFEQTWTSSDYELYPLNGIVDGQAGWPFYRIEAVGSYTFPSAYLLERRARLRVTAQWGWSSVPAPVKQACLILAAQNFQLKDAPLGVAGMNDFGVIRVVDNRMAASKLSRYVRNRVLVG